MTDVYLKQNPNFSSGHATFLVFFATLEELYSSLCPKITYLHAKQIRKKALVRNTYNIVSN